MKTNMHKGCSCHELFDHRNCIRSSFPTLFRITISEILKHIVFFRNCSNRLGHDGPVSLDQLSIPTATWPVRASRLETKDAHASRLLFIRLNRCRLVNRVQPDETSRVPCFQRFVAWGSSPFIGISAHSIMGIIKEMGWAQVGPTRGLKGVCVAADDREREEDRAWKRIHAGPPYTPTTPIYSIQKNYVTYRWRNIVIVIDNRDDEDFRKILSILNEAFYRPFIVEDFR